MQERCDFEPSVRTSLTDEGFSKMMRDVLVASDAQALKLGGTAHLSRRQMPLLAFHGTPLSRRSSSVRPFCST